MLKQNLGVRDSEPFCFDAYLWVMFQNLSYSLGQLKEGMSMFTDINIAKIAFLKFISIEMIK